MLSILTLSILMSRGTSSVVEGAPTSAFISAPSASPLGSAPRSFQQQITHSSVPSSAQQSTRLLSSSGGFGEKKQKTKKSRRSTSPSSSSSATSSYELFELQELRAQLQTILKDNILIQNLSTEKREELSKYVKAVVEKAESPVNFSGKGGNTMGIAQFVSGVEGKSWRMVFTTDTSGSDDGGSGGAAGDLPYGSTVLLRIGEFMGTEGSLDYVLKFSKRVMGLNELVAKSSCSVDVSGICKHLALRFQKFLLIIHPHMQPVCRLDQSALACSLSSTRISKPTSLECRICLLVSSDC